MEGSSKEAYIGIDTANAMMVTDASSSRCGGKSFNLKLIVGEVTFYVALDVVSYRAALIDIDVFVLPVLCTSADNRPYNEEGFMILSLGTWLWLWTNERGISRLI
ncbi:putative Heterokaryon incompatibility domain-containing protein [Seiridium cardinale]